MFNADDIVINLTLEQILSVLTEYDIWRKYCPNFQEINKSFCSELYNDKNPSCRIQQAQSGKLMYKDFGTGENFTCFSYIQAKYNTTFKESLQIIANDFGLLKIKSKDKSSFILGLESSNISIKPIIKSKITIEPRSWNLADYNYWWKQYGITFELLEEYDVFPCKTVILHKSDKSIIFNITKDNPAYAYRFTNNGEYNYKIYKPLETNKRYKWLFSGKANDIEGYSQLSLFGELLIITKSLKDVMIYRMLGFNAISLQGEMNILDSQLVTKLYKRFTTIVVQYDNDNCGISSAIKLQKSYNFSIFIIPIESGCKDLADYMQKYGFKDTLKLVTEEWKLKPEIIA